MTCKLKSCVYAEPQNCEGCKFYSKRYKHATHGGYPETAPLHPPVSPNDGETKTTVENSGGSCSYYDVYIPEVGLVSCQDIIDKLDMDFNEGTAFKSVWRKAAARQGKLKEGNTALRDAEKVRHSGERMILKEEDK
jgi:hypothetical protein